MPACYVMPPKLYKRPTISGQAVRIKHICSCEENLQQKLNDLESWLVDMGYRAEVVELEIRKGYSIDRNMIFAKRPKQQEDSVTSI